MAKTNTGPIDQAPQPDPEQMATDALMTSVFTAATFVAATVVLATLGGLVMQLGASILNSMGAEIGLAVGLALGTLLIYLGVRRYESRIRARSANLYRGIWLGTGLSLAIIVVMAYLPQVALPGYCPPGGMC
ncbi:MAG: hypothetical protein WCF36_09640 [Candidatus Nanopelagicales bacterium]